MRGTAPHAEWADKLPSSWISTLGHCLRMHNPFVRSLSHLNSIDRAFCPHAHLTLQDQGTASEIAVVMNYSNTTNSEIGSRNILVIRKDGENQTISTISRLWEPLVYPLFYPHGTLGWGVVGSTADIEFGRTEGDTDDLDGATRQIMHYRSRLLREHRFRIFGRLTNEYVVDMFSRNLETCLNYIRMNQSRLREEDAALMGLSYVPDNQNIYLPASFLGSNRWASEQISDSLAIAATYGPPTFFITMTCNTNWPEIQSELRPGQDFTDIPTVVVRVFRRKLSLLESALKTMFPQAGRILYLVHSIEFQKRGIPHVHILIKYERDCLHPDDINHVVSAEIPEDVDDAQLVYTFMIHNHPDEHHEMSKYCQYIDRLGRRTCRFHYPHTLQQLTTIDIEGRVHYRRRKEGDDMVVPHCLPLLRRFKCHLNFEVANSSHIFQYLFKYIHKGPDKARYRIHAQNSADAVDEIDNYWNARYLSAGEATWCILGFHMTKKEPAVTAVSVHLPGANSNRQYTRRRSQSSSMSSLNHYFCRPNGSFMHEGNVRTFQSLTYMEYFSLFRLTKYDADRALVPNHFLEQPNEFGDPQMRVVLRNSARRHIGRIHDVPPSYSELFYLRALLQHRPAVSFEDAHTVDNMEYDTYQEATTELGLFANEKEAEYALLEGIQNLKTPRQLRVLFVHLLVNDCIPTPMILWDQLGPTLSQDHILQHGNVTDVGIGLSLSEMAGYLEEYGKKLADSKLPEPIVHGREVEHELSRWNSDRDVLRSRADDAASQLNPEQQQLYDDVLDAVENNHPLYAFVDGKAGMGKTFLVNTICDKLRSLGHIVLPTAITGFAAQNYAGGRTTHSAFKVPVNENNKMLISPVQPNDPRGELIRLSVAIISDEAPMANKAVLTCVEETCRRAAGNNRLFGGKIIIFLGDFRQTCPVIRGGSKAQVVDASIRNCSFWSQFRIYRLIRHQRNAEDPEFARFIDAIGDGAGPEVPLHMLRRVEEMDDVIDFVYPPHVLRHPVECLKRSILAPTNRQVDAYNDAILRRIEGRERLYMAADSLKEVNAAGLTSPASALDFAAKQTPPGLPSHSMSIKVNGIYRLIRNFSLDRGLVKNVRVIVTDIGNRLITVKLIRNVFGREETYGDDLLIPRIPFTFILPSGHTLLRRQYPFAPGYATTFNSCQGLNLIAVGLDLIQPVFAHGQLYTALSHIPNRHSAVVRLRPGEHCTTNVTYPELLLR